jgi:hypothetical protein
LPLSSLPPSPSLSLSAVRDFSPGVTTVFFSSFVVIVLFLLFNMILAVILSVYDDTNQKAKLEIATMHEKREKALIEISKDDDKTQTRNRLRPRSTLFFKNLKKTPPIQTSPPIPAKSSEKEPERKRFRFRKR